MHQSQFDAETAITPAGENRWTADISAAWNIHDHSNGGYLLTPALRAMQDLSGHLDPLTVTTHFLRPGHGDTSAEVTAEVLKPGRIITTTTGQVIQKGKPRLSMMAGFGDLTQQTGWGGDCSADFTIPMPDMPGPDECIERSSLNQGVPVALNSRAEIMIVPEEPAPGLLAAHFWCDDLVAGKMIESGRLWDSTGALVAQSRQIGLLL